MIFTIVCLSTIIFSTVFAFNLTTMVISIISEIIIISMFRYVPSQVFKQYCYEYANDIMNIHVKV